MSLDDDTKRIICDACIEGRFDEAIQLLEAKMSPNGFVLHSNLFRDLPAGALDLQEAPPEFIDPLFLGKESKGDNVIQRGNDRCGTPPAIFIRPRSVKLAIVGCLFDRSDASVSQPHVAIQVTSDGNVTVVIRNARVTG